MDSSLPEKKVTWAVTQDPEVYTFNIRKTQKGKFSPLNYSEQDVFVLKNFLIKKGISTEYIHIALRDADLTPDGVFKMDIDCVKKNELLFVIRIIIS